jgi:hypothetical protein
MIPSDLACLNYELDQVGSISDGNIDDGRNMNNGKRIDDGIPHVLTERETIGGIETTRRTSAMTGTKTMERIKTVAKIVHDENLRVCLPSLREERLHAHLVILGFSVKR